MASEEQYVAELIQQIRGRVHNGLNTAATKLLTFEVDNRLLVDKIQLIVDYMDERGLLEDDAFTLPDGDTWVAKPKAR